VIPIFKRASRQAIFADTPRKSYTPSQQRQAVSYLRGNLQAGWEDFFFHTLRKTRTGYTIQNICPKCGEVPPKDMHSALARRRYMFSHAITEH
jgi:hypothetical protein